MSDNPYRDLPAVDVLADSVESALPRAVVVELARQALERSREGIASGRTPDPVAELGGLLRFFERGSTLRVINATGVLLHTNLGRATWSDKAVAAALVAAGSPTNLEIDLDTGERSARGSHISNLLRHLTGAEDALVVNNNASALLVALKALADGRAVPISRGELIEIGGAYRLPEVMAAAGARMIEVGTTNRTRLGDYQVALQTHQCGAILKVHPSNYRVEGFTEEVGVADLTSLKAEIPLIHDIGSGLLDGDASWIPDWLRDEPAAKQSLEMGADVVLFSGDKLLGGPQAGVAVGNRDVIARMRAHPLTRALRVDGVTHAALAATLMAYFEDSPLEIPFWRQALADLDILRKRSEQLAEAVGARVEQGVAEVGAGSAPGRALAGPVVRIPGADGLFECLLGQPVPVLARRDRGDLIIDVRAVEPEDDELVAATINKCR